MTRTWHFYAHDTVVETVLSCRTKKKEGAAILKESVKKKTVTSKKE